MAKPTMPERPRCPSCKRKLPPACRHWANSVLKGYVCSHCEIRIVIGDAYYPGVWPAAQRWVERGAVLPNGSDGQLVLTNWKE